MRISLFRTWAGHWLVPLAIVVISFVAVVVGWLRPALTEVRENATLLSLERANAVALEIAHAPVVVAAELQAAAQVIGSNPEESEAILSRLLAGNPSYESIAVVGGDGYETVRQFSEQFPASQALGTRVHFEEDYFHRALEGSGGFGKIIFNRTRQSLIVFAYPISGHDGLVTGAVVADVVLGEIIDPALLAVSEGEKIYIVDGEGKIILHSDPRVVAENSNILFLPFIQKLIIGRETVAGDEPVATTDDESGEVMFTVGVPASLGWGVVVEKPWNEALSGERRVVVLALLFSLLTILFFLFMLKRQYDLEKINETTQHLLEENQSSAKLLVQKDRELHKSNDDLEETNQSLSDTARILIRRDRELSEANERLEELDVVKSEFVSVAAHQLRTPLTGVRWSLKGLAGGEYGPLNPDQHKAADDALSAIIGAIDLINDMLNVARIEGGRFGFAFKEQSVAPLVIKLVGELQNHAAERNVTLTLEGADESIVGYLDADKLSIAISNVVDNAIKYTPSGGTVTVGMHKEGEGVVITVHDTGIGISKDDQERLFTKFFRAPNAVLMQTSGTGLGLYLVKNIVEKHKGTVTIDSKEGQGTTFIIMLPLAGARSKKA